MRLAILGAGNVGKALGEGWARTGHTIVYGVRNPADPKHAAVAQAAGGAKVATLGDAVQGADAIVLAVNWGSVQDALGQCGDLAGRVLIDVTNPLRFGADGLELAVGYETSAGELVAQWAKGARVVKTLNHIGAVAMAPADRYVTPPVMFAASDDAAAKALAMGLVGELGFQARDAGPLKSARLLEPFAMLWISQSMIYGAPAGSAFALLPRVR